MAIDTPDDPFPDGQVEIADGVAFADAVVLDAAPGCRLIVAPGVCLGNGVIIQAHGGDLVIEPRAVLGSGVLVVGAGRIGQNACIGADSTLIHPSIQASQMVPPNSLLGDPSQPSNPPPGPGLDGLFPSQPGEPAPTEPIADLAPPPSPEPPGSASPVAAPPEMAHPSTETLSPAGDSPPVIEAPTPPDSLTPPEPTPDSPTSTVHGQQQVQALLAALFPHRQPLNGLSPEDRP